MKRTPLSRGPGPSRKAPIKRNRKPLKQKRGPISPEVRAARKAVSARSGGICERCQRARATAYHHRLLRSGGGLDTPQNLAHLCDACHTGPEGVHAHPEEARAQGWIISRFAAPRTQGDTDAR